MSERKTLARPYADATFHLAQEQGDLKTWSELLQTLSAVSVDADMTQLATNPNVTHEQVAEVFLGVVGEVSDQGQSFLRLLLENDRLSLLPEIAELFEVQKAEAEGRIEAEVISAYELDTRQVKAIAAGLKGKLGRDVDITTQINPELVGGIVIRAGDIVIDGSVEGRLAALSSQLNR